MKSLIVKKIYSMRKYMLNPTLWCVCLSILCVIIFLFVSPSLEYGSFEYSIILAILPGVSASALVTFFSEYSAQLHKRREISIKLANLFYFLEKCNIQNHSSKNPENSLVVGIERLFNESAIYIMSNIDELLIVLNDALTIHRDYLNVQEIELIKEIKDSLEYIIEEIVICAEKECGEIKGNDLTSYLEKASIREELKSCARVYFKDLIFNHNSLLNDEITSDFFDIMFYIQTKMWELEGVFVCKGYISRKD